VFIELYWGGGLIGVGEIHYYLRRHLSKTV